MQWLRKEAGAAERGATSVMVALLMVPLMGFAAVTIDLGAMWSDKTKLHNGADAAAIAIAQACGRNNCGSPSSTAQTYVTANAGTGATATIMNGTVTPSTGKVKVKASKVRQHWFAPVLGKEQSSVAAESTATWGGIGKAITISTTVSWCSFKQQTGGGLPSATTEYTIKLRESNTCAGPLSTVVPGGFGWLKPNKDNCLVETQVGNLQLSDPGNSPANSCSTSDWVSLQNTTVLVPIYDLAAGTGSNAVYRIYGFAAFRLTGYYFAGQYGWNNPCNGNNRCIRGYFTNYVDISTAYETSPTAPKLGATAVRLTANGGS